MQIESYETYVEQKGPTGLRFYQYVIDLVIKPQWSPFMYYRQNVVYA